ncbi:MAG: hypothetical protein QOE13_960 [Gaiellaceae bacterium]|jgi:hypothetical protein|nr:hypothetical protein [Gaiellaceae bacterium]
MGNLVFISGDFSSGTTLAFTLLRQTEDCHCLYEPLHERLLHWLVWSPRPYDGHAFVGDYVREYKGFSAIPQLFDPAWGVSGLHLAADADAPGLFRYLSYLIGTAYARERNVVLKENRITFRLDWLRANFPQAKILHVWRDVDAQWASVVRRVQEHLQRADVGQDSVDFMGFRLAAWCDDLAPTFPELARDASSTGYERFSKLWELSRREHERHADVSVELADLKTDFEGTCRRISADIGFELDAVRLRPYLSTGKRQAPHNGAHQRLERAVDGLGQRYAEIRVRRRARTGDG